MATRIYKLHTNERPLGLYTTTRPTLDMATAYARVKMETVGMPLSEVIYSWTEIQLEPIPSTTQRHETVAEPIQETKGSASDMMDRYCKFLDR